MNQPNILTERLILRTFGLSDARDVQRLAGNINVAKMTLNVPHPYENDMAEEWINSHKEKTDSGIQITYAIESLQLGVLIGAISLTHIEAKQANLGYWVGEQYWGKGYCTEAGKALIDHAFDELLLNRVYALHLTSNPASGRVMQKIGMTHYATEERQDRLGRPASMELYEIECT